MVLEFRKCKNLATICFRLILDFFRVKASRPTTFGTKVLKRANVPQPLGPIHSSTPKENLGSAGLRQMQQGPENASFVALMPNK